MADEVRHTGPGESRTIGVPLATTNAKGLVPDHGGGSDEPPLFTVVVWNDEPVLYQRVIHKEP